MYPMRPRGSADRQMLEFLCGKLREYGIDSEISEFPAPSLKVRAGGKTIDVLADPQNMTFVWDEEERVYTEGHWSGRRIRASMSNAVPSIRRWVLRAGQRDA